MVRVVYVTPDWLPYSTADEFLRASPIKETQSLKFYDIAIWEENKSIQLYSIPNSYFDNRPNNGDPKVESYRESFAIAKIDGLPEGYGSIERSEFLKNAMKSFVSSLVKLHPKAAHHLEFNGHGAPGGQFFSGFILPKHVTELLSFWNQKLGHKLGVIDLGGPCNMGDFTTLETVSNYTDYFVGSDLPNGGYTMDEWTFEKFAETEPDFQYHRIFRDYPTLLDGLKERINIRRKCYEYSREYMINHEVQQANYLYSCQSFIAFSTAFKAYLLKNKLYFYNCYFGDPKYNWYGDLYGFLLNQKNDSLLALFNKIILHQANNRDFFDWKGSFNGLISPIRSGNLPLNIVPPFVELLPDIIAQENDRLSIEVKAYDIEEDKLTYSWRQLSGPPVFMENSTSAKITFTVPKFDPKNILKLEVSVEDGEYSITDTVSVLSLVANAGTDQSVSKGLIVTLDGSSSYSPDGKLLTYKWTAPDGILLSSTTMANPTFIAPIVTSNTDYTFSLVVNDGTVDSPADQVIISVKNTNKPPFANAGTDQFVNEGTTVTLDGFASSDPDGDQLTYKWTVPAGITLNSTTVAKPTFTAPEVTTNTNYTLSLVVNDGMVDSPVDQVVITVKNINKAPVANAGIDQSVNEGTTVALDGSTSSDPDGNSLTYKWTAPAGITLSSTNVAKPTFTAPEVLANTNYTFSLIVNDGTIDSPADQVVIIVKNINKAPVANAGIDQSVNEGSTVILDGSVSSDPDGSTITYKWTVPSGISLSSATIAKPTFTAPEVTTNTDYTFSLVVNDGTVNSPIDQVVITVKNINKAPVANAGIDQSVNEGTTVALDGSTSSDPDGNSLTYKWTAPAGITLSSTNMAKPTFTAPEVTTNTNYTFSLVVNDGTVDSPADQVVIIVKNINKAPVANAGADQSANEGASISLDGSTSSDPDGNPLTYKWTAPTGITLSSTTVAKPTFTAPEVTTNTDYTFSLVVNDGTVNSPIDQVVITVRNVNKVPVANAGIDQSVNEGAIISLDGSASSDHDGNTLTYKWTAPAVITLSSTTVAKPTFTAPEVKKDSTINFSLIVNDGLVNSLPSTVKVTVLNVIKVGVTTIESPLLKIYPNPTTGIVNLEISGGMNREGEVVVTNLVGAEVFRKEKTDIANLQIDLSNQVNGIYMLKILVENQQYISKIIVRKQ